MTITLVKVVQTSVAAPSQWDAWDENGDQYYMRYRHGRGRVDGVQEDHMAYVDANFTRCNDPADSYISLSDFLELAGMRLAPDAVVRTLEEETVMADTATVDTAVDHNDPAAALAPAPPAPKSQGTYALYDLPDGSLLLVYQEKGDPEPKRIPIPAFIVSMAEKAAAGEGVSSGMLGKLLGGAL